MTTFVAPAQLTASVYEAVAQGAWTLDDVTATVMAEVRASRSDVAAALWDLVDDGLLVHDAAAPYATFRAAAARPLVH